LVFAVTFVVAVAAMSAVVSTDTTPSDDTEGEAPSVVLSYAAPYAPTVQAVPIGLYDDEESSDHFRSAALDNSDSPALYYDDYPTPIVPLAQRVVSGENIDYTAEEPEIMLTEDYQHPAEDEEDPAAQAPAESPVIRFYAPRPMTEVPDTFRYLPDIPLSESLQRYTYMKSREIGFDYVLALALMWQESNFRTGAISHNTNGTQDSGIMQINDVNRGWLYREMNIYDLMNPYQNIDAGMEILRRLNDAHGEHFAIMGYQLGEAGMLRQVERGVTTTRHTDLVYQRHAQLVEMFAALD